MSGHTEDLRRAGRAFALSRRVERVAQGKRTRPRGLDSAPTGIARVEAHEFSARALAGRRFAPVTER